MIVDVTDRKQAEAEAEAARLQELALVREKLAHLERSMKSSLMAAAVAHDVQQPLVMALFHAEQLLNRVTDEPLQVDARAILNPVTNAIEALGRADGEGRTIRVELVEAERDVEVVVWDSGPGSERLPGGAAFRPVPPSPRAGV